MRLYLARHGESRANLEQRHQGRLYDTELTEAGMKQAANLARHLSTWSFSAIYTSQLQRALATAEAIQEKHPTLELTVDTRLEEIDRGDFAGMLMSEAEPLWEALGVDDCYARRPPGGESVYDHVERVRPFFGEVPLTDGTLIVSHGGTMRAVLMLLLGRSAAYVHEHYRMPNTCVYELTSAGRENWAAQLIFSPSHAV